MGVIRIWGHIVDILGGILDTFFDHFMVIFARFEVICVDSMWGAGSRGWVEWESNKKPQLFDVSLVTDITF